MIKTVVFWLVILVAAAVLWQSVRTENSGPKITEISYSEFLSRVEAGEVIKVAISYREIQVTGRNGVVSRVIFHGNQESLIQTLRSKSVEIWFRDLDLPGRSWLAQVLLSWGPLIMLGALWFFMIRQMQRGRRTKTDSGPIG
jgi:cell division protease FtsH